VAERTEDGWLEMKQAALSRGLSIGRSPGSVAGSAFAIRSHAGLRIAELEANALGQVRNGRTDEREDEKAQADDRGGQNHPVNGHGASFVFQESGEFGHGLVPF
jgi:hypothetical protein